MSIEEFKFARDFLLALGDNYHAAKSDSSGPASNASIGRSTGSTANSPKASMALGRR